MARGPTDEAVRSAKRRMMARKLRQLDAEGIGYVALHTQRGRLRAVALRCARGHIMLWPGLQRASSGETWLTWSHAIVAGDAQPASIRAVKEAWEP